MHTNLKRVALSLAALTAASAGLVLSSTSASALPPGTPPVAPAILSPLTGNALTTNYTLTPTPATNSFCPGDSAAGGYSVRTFMTQQDPATLTYNAAGPVGAGFTQPLFTAAGSPITGNNTAPAAPPAVTGRILGLGQLSFSLLSPVPNGAYSIGIACVKAGVTETYYSTQVTFTNDNWAFGATPAAPALTSTSYDAATTTATVNFTHAASTPATTGYTATVSGIGTIPVPAGATSFTFPLALGASATVSLVATNPTGPSAASNTLTVVGAATAPAPVVTANDVFENDPITASWTAPGGPVAPTDYTVVLSGGSPAITPVSQTVAGLTTSFATQPVGSYSVTVTPNYPAASGVTGTAGVDTLNVTPGALIKQELTVTRPKGALILTQRCGVFNDLPAFTAVANFPGYPFTMGPATATANQVGTAPTLDAGGADGEFGNYPLPNDDLASGADVPFGNVTTCGLDMGVARFVTESNISVGGSGAQFLTGNFFAASGRLNEVTVLDTRDIDAGWTLRGDIEDRFTQPNGDSFSGDYLGWQPVMTDDSNIVGGEGPGAGGTGALYDQTVLPGSTVLPGDGFPAGSGFAPGAIGMTDNPVLATAALGSGLGISTHDARLMLLIPVTRDSGNYAATMTLTVG
jgi:hypothetical protein